MLDDTHDQIPLQHHLLAVSLVFALTSIVAAMDSAYFIQVLASLDIESTWGNEFMMSLTYWWPLALLTPPILVVCRRYSLRRRNWLRMLPLHIAASLFFGIAKSVIEPLAQYVFLQTELSFFTAASLPQACFDYWVFLAADSGFSYYRRFRAHETRAGRLEIQLAEARLEILKMQLRPHFLFNTLHAISTLVHEDARAADRMICRLSDLLRLSLEGTGQQETPLRQELDFLAPYLEIEKIRFGEQLVIRMDIADDTLDAAVPSFILQPIVENAIKHGMDPVTSQGTLTLRSSQADDNLRVDVCDSGQGPQNGNLMDSAHVGLKNTGERMEQLYGPNGEISCFSSPEGGFCVRLTIPLHTVCQ